MNTVLPRPTLDVRPALVNSSFAPTAAPPLASVLAGDESSWRAFVAHFDPRLRAVVRQVAAVPDDELDDVMGDFWLTVVEQDKRLLRRFAPGHGAELITWLTFHVARVVYERLTANAATPPLVPLRRARHVAAPVGFGAAPTLDTALREVVRSTVAAVVRAELAQAKRERADEDADRPRSAAWWAGQLGCSAESLVKRAKRGSLEYAKVGARYHFTRAHIERARRALPPMSNLDDS